MKTSIRGSLRPACSLACAVMLAAVACPCCSGQVVRGFGTPEGKRALPGFGDPLQGELTLRRQFPALAAAVNNADRDGAAREIKRTDLNGDGIVTEAEWSESKFQTIERFHWNDLNGDGTLTLFEHSLRWAQARLARQPSPLPNEGSQRAGALQPEQKGPTSPADLLAESRRQQTKDLAALTLSTYDRNRNGSLERTEFRNPMSPFGSIRAADADGDGVVGPPEMATWLSSRLARQSGITLSTGVPAWFSISDLDGDGQVHLAEFLRTSGPARIAEFARYDRNRDGFVTAKELASPGSDGTQRYASSLAQVVEADRETVAQLLIPEQFPIADIDVQLALVKSGDDELELTLIGPDGTRATLFFDGRVKAWGGGRLFENTLIDDEIPPIKERLPRPPLNRAFPSQGSTTAGMQGLKSLYGKPARGTWRLSIRNKSRDAGMLEGWALLIKPAKPAPSAAAGGGR